MPEEMLGWDEVKRIAKEYVRRTEYAADIEFTEAKWAYLGRLLVCEVQGKARRKTVDAKPDELWQAGVVEECSFTLQVSAKDGNVEHYYSDGWKGKNRKQAPPIGSYEAISPITDFPTSPTLKASQKHLWRQFRICS